MLSTITAIPINSKAIATNINTNDVSLFPIEFLLNLFISVSTFRFLFYLAFIEFFVTLNRSRNFRLIVGPAIINLVFAKHLNLRHMFSYFYHFFILILRSIITHAVTLDIYR